MISCVRGKVAEKSADHLVVMVGGFGLEVLAPVGTIDKAPEAGHDIALYTYLLVRQDALVLYGFESARSRDLFVKLTGVSGLGPSKALAILSFFSPSRFEEVIGAGDVDQLAAIKGIGKKTAQRIVLEMKDKLVLPDEELSGVAEQMQTVIKEAAGALVALGYSRAEALEALKLFPPGEDGATVEEVLQFALKSMTRAQP